MLGILEFPPEYKVYAYKHGGKVYSQNVLMEYQRHLMSVVSAFVNSKYRRSLSLNWDYLIYLSNCLSEKDNIANIVKTDEIEVVCKNIAAAYTLLEKYISQCTHESLGHKVKMVQYNTADLSGFASSILNAINSKYAGIAEELAGAYVHGSFGSMDYNAYSDIDMLVVISNESCKNPVSLLKIRDVLAEINSLVFSYDPLQHHGVFVLSEIDLKYYPEAFLPLSVFDNSRVFIGGSELNLDVRKSDFDALRSYLITIKMLKNWSINRNRLTNMDRIKRFNSNLLLLPSLYLETKNIFSYKRESFELIKKHISNESEYSLSIASEIRNKWENERFNFKLERFFIKLQLIPQYAVRFFCSRTVDKLYFKKFNKYYDDAFWKSFDLLLDEMDKTTG